MVVSWPGSAARRRQDRAQWRIHRVGFGASRARRIDETCCGSEAWDRRCTQSESPLLSGSDALRTIERRPRARVRHPDGGSVAAARDRFAHRCTQVVHQRHSSPTRGCLWPRRKRPFRAPRRHSRQRSGESHGERRPSSTCPANVAAHLGQRESRIPPSAGARASATRFRQVQRCVMRRHGVCRPSFSAVRTPRSMPLLVRAE